MVRHTKRKASALFFVRCHAHAVCIGTVKVVKQKLIQMSKQAYPPPPVDALPTAWEKHTVITRTKAQQQQPE